MKAVEAFDESVRQMERVKLGNERQRTCYLGMIARSLAEIVDMMKEEKTCEEGRQRPETDISNSCTS